jgi:hypothetical protein
MGGTLAEVPDMDTNKFVHSLVVESGIYSALIGLYRPPDVDEGRAYETVGWRWASSNNDTGYRQWASTTARQGGGPFDRCAIVTTAYFGNWLGVACSKHYINDGCLCQAGGREPPAFDRLVQELEEPKLMNRLSVAVSTAVIWVLWALCISCIAPYILRRLFKPFVRWVATKLCGTAAIGPISSTDGEGLLNSGGSGFDPDSSTTTASLDGNTPLSSLNSKPPISSLTKSKSFAALLIGVDSEIDVDDDGVVVGGKRIPRVAIAICDGLDWATAVCNRWGELMVMGAQVAMISPVWTSLYYTVDFRRRRPI